MSSTIKREPMDSFLPDGNLDIRKRLSSSFVKASNSTSLNVFESDGKEPAVLCETEGNNSGLSERDLVTPTGSPLDQNEHLLLSGSSSILLRSPCDFPSENELVNTSFDGGIAVTDNEGNVGSSQMDETRLKYLAGSHTPYHEIEERICKMAGSTVNLPNLVYTDERPSRNRVRVDNLITPTRQMVVSLFPFEQFGNTYVAYVDSGRNYAFVYFETLANAQRAVRVVNGISISGCTLNVRMAPLNAAVIVKNLTPFVSNELLAYAFSVFGQVERAVILTDLKGNSKNEGIVKFSSVEACHNAVKYCQERFFLLTGSTVPAIVDYHETANYFRGISDESLKRDKGFVKERQEGPRFADSGSFEEAYGREWYRVYRTFAVHSQNIKRDFDSEVVDMMARLDFSKSKYLNEQLEREVQANKINLLLKQKELEERSKARECERRNRVEHHPPPLLDQVPAMSNEPLASFNRNNLNRSSNQMPVQGPIMPHCAPGLHHGNSNYSYPQRGPQEPTHNVISNQYRGNVRRNRGGHMGGRGGNTSGYGGNDRGGCVDGYSGNGVGFGDDMEKPGGKVEIQARNVEGYNGNMGGHTGHIGGYGGNMGRRNGGNMGRRGGIMGGRGGNKGGPADYNSNGTYPTAYFGGQGGVAGEMCRQGDAMQMVSGDGRGEVSSEMGRQGSSMQMVSSGGRGEVASEIGRQGGFMQMVSDGGRGEVADESDFVSGRQTGTGFGADNGFHGGGHVGVRGGNSRGRGGSVRGRGSNRGGYVYNSGGPGSNVGGLGGYNDGDASKMVSYGGHGDVASEMGKQGISGYGVGNDGRDGYRGSAIRGRAMAATDGMAELAGYGGNVGIHGGRVGNMVGSSKMKVSFVDQNANDAGERGCSWRNSNDNYFEDSKRQRIC